MDWIQRESNNAFTWKKMHSFNWMNCHLQRGLFLKCFQTKLATLVMIKKKKKFSVTSSRIRLMVLPWQWISLGGNGLLFRRKIRNSGPNLSEKVERKREGIKLNLWWPNWPEGVSPIHYKTTLIHVPFHHSIPTLVSTRNSSLGHWYYFQSKLKMRYIFMIFQTRK